MGGRTRMSPSSAPKPPPPKAPTTREGWRALMEQALAKATETGDRRLQGLLKARQDGREETYLRGLGIISAACLEREFPAKMPNT